MSVRVTRRALVFGSPVAAATALMSSRSGSAAESVAPVSAAPSGGGLARLIAKAELALNVSNPSTSAAASTARQRRHWRCVRNEPTS